MLIIVAVLALSLSTNMPTIMRRNEESVVGFIRLFDENVVLSPKTFNNHNYSAHK